MKQNDSRICPRCGCMLPGNAKFCWGCGESLPSEEADTARKRKRLLPAILIGALCALLAGGAVLIAALTTRSPQQDPGVQTVAARSSDPVELLCAGRWMLVSVSRRYVDVETQILPGSLTLTLSDDRTGTLVYGTEQHALTWEHVEADASPTGTVSNCFLLKLHTGGLDSELCYQTETGTLMLQTENYTLTLRRG